MPHLQASSGTKVLAEGDRETRKNSSSGGRLPTCDSPTTPGFPTDHLPIQEATKGFLGTSDPVVAMANKADKVEKVSFDESVERLSNTASPTVESRISKTLVTPSPHATQSRLLAGVAGNSESASEKKSSSSEEGSPPILTIYGNARLIHSPIRVKRRVSNSEDDDVVDATPAEMNSKIATHLRYGGESPVEEDVSRPVLIRRGSSVGKRAASDDAGDAAVNTSRPKRVKMNTGNTYSDEDLESSVEEVAAAMAGMRKKTVISPSTSGDKLDSFYQQRNTPPSMTGYHDGHSSQYYTHQLHQPNPLYQASFPYHHYSHPSYGYGYGAHSMYHGHGYPSNAAHHPSYYPPYSVPSHSTTHAYRAPPIHAAALDHPARKVTKPFLGRTSSIPKDPVGPERTSSTGSESYPLVSTEWQAATGTALSSNRCIPLKEPVPNKAWEENDDSKEAALPDFHRLVNYPDFLTKARSEANCPSGKKNCVMCGKLRISSSNSYVSKGRHGNTPMLKAHTGEGCEDTSHIIPRQNKGLCTACDVTVWVFVSENLEIKWCKGCKNFRPWAAFGDKGSATKCVRCRDRQREKYALQRDEMRCRRTQRGTSSSPDSISSNKMGDQAPMAAAQGLRNLLNAATTV
ncbi:hypothetical protein IV203_008926 [Nitzschia inconspicua]|uniref:Uncharacterized protein n=1 Tax=Nitzschia inconspicua TaxID=303405 RepID=A0A9K3L0Y0_9STRA|nr:hypothetical protein IV203_008926 [Nitzschia inconspicua]